MMSLSGMKTNWMIIKSKKIIHIHIGRQYTTVAVVCLLQFLQNERKHTK